MLAKLVKYDDLPTSVQRQVMSAYPYWHYDKTVSTKLEWARKKAFYVTKKGGLALTPKHCEPSFMADA